MLVLCSRHFNWLYNHHLFFQQPCFSAVMCVHNSQIPLGACHPSSFNKPRLWFSSVSPADVFRVKDVEPRAHRLGEAGRKHEQEVWRKFSPEPGSFSFGVLLSAFGVDDSIAKMEMWASSSPLVPFLIGKDRAFKWVTKWEQTLDSY